MYERLSNIIKATGQPKVLLVGDFMLDHYVYGNIDRISPEAPVMVLNVEERQEQPGGAGSVAIDLAVMDAEVACLGVVGNDAGGERLRQMLTDTGRINVDGLLPIENRPTTLKQRIIGLAQHRHQQQLMRIDEEDSSPISPQTQKQLHTHLEKLIQWCDVVCLEDYNKGVLCDDFCRLVIELAAEANKKTIVDPAAIDTYHRYDGAWLIKPNRRELTLATNLEIDGQESYILAARKLAHDHNLTNIVVTLDKQGAYLYQREKDTGELIPTRPRSVYDVTGAGDVVLATLGLLTGGQYENIDPPCVNEMVCLANVAGGLEVERFGCVGLSRQELLDELALQRRTKTSKLRNLDALLHDVQQHRRQKLKIVLTNGCFDILHPGHINLLSFAKEQGDILIVAINSDSSVRTLKGESRPILKQQDRAALLSAIEAVDYVIIFDELEPLHLIQKIAPDVLVKGSDWTGAVVGQEWIEKHGGKIVLMPLVKGRSTTNIINQVIESYNNGHAKNE
ncbi:MAG: D-glycero-beta-D-manno-heptose 1-phosphate adenylyltransferase [Sedimentisphaerales bacterium]|nr:D-glycero-beta-D-manno-heptose 1-phosphate adenylyltransferase [Sedimentisphaerales bacterium]